ncbi:MAG: acyl-CoA dehydrogenase C-terminal domain-containing protein, partial [Quisquiliibacterium sp.]
ARAIIAQLRVTESELAAEKSGDLAAIRNSLAAGASALEQAVEFIVANSRSDVRAVFAGSVPYLRLAGIVLCGWQMARAAQAATRLLAQGGDDKPFLTAKIATARFFADHILSQAAGLSSSIVNGAPGALALTEDQF